MDLKWLTTTDQSSEVQRVQAAEHMLQMYQAIDECPYPVIARVHGPAFGGGAGLLATCDMAVASPDATFAFREVRLGLIPAIIAPYLTRLCLTGESFSADVAKHIGLVHDVVSTEELDSHIYMLVEHILQGGPEAIKETKKFLRQLLTLPDQDKWPLCTKVNAEMRGSAEAAEGLLAFVEKRPPQWVKQSSPAETGAR
jgi:methylglutaconyl-CoA hydratase